MMMESPVVYLEGEDIDPSTGGLLTPLKIPVFVMVQTNGCGHCKVAKPKYQLAAEIDANRPGGPGAMWASIDLEDPNSRMALQAMIKGGAVPEKIMAGVPCYFVIVRDVILQYNGNRSTEDLLAFVDNVSSSGMKH